MSEQIKLRIGGEYTAGPAFKKADDDIKRVGEQAKKTGRELGELAKGFSQGIGQGFAGAALNQLSQIPQVLEAAVRKGVEFNATLESARLGIAATMKQFDTSGRFENFQTALGAAGDAIDLLKQKAAESPATFEQLVQGFQGLSGAFSSAGLGMRQQVDLVVLMSQSLSGLGIKSDQLLQESRALVTGDINQDAQAAKILGITKAQVDSARESGQLFDFLTEKLGAFAEAGAAGAKSFNTQLSNLEDAITQLAGVATEEVFAQIRDGLAGINKELTGEKAAQWAAGFGGALAGVAQDVPVIAGKIGELLKTLPGGEKFWSLKNTAAYKNWAPMFEPAMAAKREEQLGAEREKLNTGLHLAGDEPAKKKAVADLEAAISKRRAEAEEASGEEKHSLEQHLKILESILARREKLLGVVAAGTALAQKAADLESKAPVRDWYGDPKNLAAGFKASGESTARNRKLGEDVADFEAADMGPRERAARLRQSLAEARGSFRDDLSQGKGVDLAAGFSAGDAQSAIGGLSDTEAAAHFGERLKRIMELQKATKEAEKSAGEADSKHAELLTGLGEELAIQRELAAGHDHEAKLLEIQRNLRKELAQIAEDDLAPADRDRAADLVKQTAEMQKQQALAEQQKKLAEQQHALAKAEADNAVAAAEAGHSKRAVREAKLDQFKQQKRAELEKQNLAPADVDRLVSEASVSESRRLRRVDHVIGGSASPANRAPASSWDETFKSRGAVGGIRGTLLDRAEIQDWGAGPTTPDAWRQAFHHGGDLIPSRPPGGPSSGDKAAEVAAGGGQGEAAGKVAAAASQTAAAATALASNAAALTHLNGTLTALTAGLSGLSAAVATLQTEVERLNSEHS